jgi:hypothetical protein
LRSVAVKKENHPCAVRRFGIPFSGGRGARERSERTTTISTSTKKPRRIRRGFYFGFSER